MKALHYPIELLEPALVTSLDGDPNSAVAYDFLPGSVLRGAIIKKYLADHPALTPQTLLDANQPEQVRRLFFDETTRYLNGYLQIDDARTLPAPLAWHQLKGETAMVYDFSVVDAQDDRKWQGLSGRFCRLSEAGVRLVKPDRQIAVHTARNRRYGRPQHPDRVKPDEDPGAIYRYEALAAGQTFEAIILCDEGDAALLQSLLVGEINLGGSRTGGYGRARFGKVKVTAVDHWREVAGTLRPAVNDRLTLTLLSDALLRDDNGQFVVDPRVVAQHTRQIAPGLGDPTEASFVRGRLVGGFNRKWGLPLPQALAVQAGSTIVFDVPGCTDGQLDALAAQLRQLELNGFGERRAEGFGRVAVNWHTAAQWVVQPCPVPKSDPIPITGTEAVATAQRMARRLLRAQLDDRLVAKANELKIKPPPKRAQLSRLRNIIADELTQETPDARRVETYMKQVRERSTARKQFESAKVIGENRRPQRLADWLIDTVQQADVDKFKDLFTLQDQDLRVIGAVPPDLDQTLRAEYVMRAIGLDPALCAEYVLRLIDLVLAHAAKEGEA